MKFINAMKVWMRGATPDEQRVLSERTHSSRPYLYHLANGFRTASAEKGGEIERETKIMHRLSKGRLPIVYRTDIVPACRACDYARKCLGDRALASEFEAIDRAKLAELV